MAEERERISCRVCGRELREVEAGRFGHTVNPAAAHHYPRVRRHTAEDLPSASARDMLSPGDRWRVPFR